MIAVSATPVLSSTLFTYPSQKVEPSTCEKEDVVAGRCGEKLGLDDALQPARSTDGSRR